MKAGKVRYVGVSNFTGWQLQKAIDLAKHNGWEPFTCLQPQYNLLCRPTEWELIPVCLNEGVGIIPWSPLRGGWLSGKFRRGMQAPPEGSRVEAAEKFGWSESWTNYNTESTWKVVDELLAVAGDVARHPAQVAIRWLLQKPGVTAPIIGARTMEQLDINLGAADWTLDTEHLLRLDLVSEPRVEYPYDFIQRLQRS